MHRPLDRSRRAGRPYAPARGGVAPRPFSEWCLAVGRGTARTPGCLLSGHRWPACPRDAAQAAVRAEHLAELAREVADREVRSQHLDEHRRAVAAYTQRRRSALEAAWEGYRRAKFSNPDDVPAIIAEVAAPDEGIDDYLPAHWHAVLFEDVIQGRIGTNFTYGRAVAPFLRAPRARPRAVYCALSAYLERLRRAGYVEYRTNATGYIGDHIRVLADTKHPPDTRRSPTVADADAGLEAPRNTTALPRRIHSRNT